VREALFARLPDLSGWSVLDLYAGTGALGIEALSRGAERVVFVERRQSSLTVLRHNLHALDLETRARVVRGDFRGALPRLAAAQECFSLVLADPPYGLSDLARDLAGLALPGLLDSEATVVVERSRRHPVPLIEGLVAQESRRYGDTVLEWLAPAGGPGASETQGESNP
jgi:16S rRNA (guanine(966)-N(2))-methyltransferase RsmD